MPLTVGNYGWISYSLERTGTPAGGTSSGGGGGERAFAPPMGVLPEVVITAPRPSPLPPALPQPSLGSRVVARIGRVAARVGGRLLILLTPMNSGPDGTGDLYGSEFDPRLRPPPPPEAEALPEIIITPPRPPRRPAVGNDPIMPPNWNDLANPGDRLFESAPGRRPVNDPTRLPIPDFGDRFAPEPLGDPGELPTPDGPLVFPDLLPLPGVATRPATRPYAPDVFSDPFAMPDADAFGSPRPGPNQSTRPRPSARPGTRPGAPNPLGFVGNPLLPQLPEDYRPPTGAPGGTSLPEFLTDPYPDILADPGGDVEMPTADEQCQCDKPPKKKKPKATDRDVCRQGTYTQRKKGIKYAPRRIVPCEGEIAPERKKSRSR